MAASKTPKNSLTARRIRKYNPKSRANLRKPWEPGQSGNPKGRPMTPRDLMAALELEAKKSVETLVKLRDNRNVRPDIRADIANKLLDRRYGTAKTHAVQEMTGPEGAPLDLSCFTDAQLEAIADSGDQESAKASPSSGSEEAAREAVADPLHSVGDTEAATGSADPIAETPPGDAGLPPGSEGSA